ncbi:MAG TPA: response regulator transcription factor [Burkholderiaceae bacterium]|nr:response regulator transcription factor [Burkholderiaceae bacterium]
MDLLEVPTEQHTAKLLLIDDHDLVRVGLRAALEATSDLPLQWREAQTLSDGMQAYAAEADSIDLVLLDLNLSDCKGLQGLRQFMETFPHARVAVLSGTQDEFVVGQAKALGAVGYLPKAQSPKITCASILGMLNLSESVAATVPAALTSALRFPSAATYDRIAELGPRHLEILELILSGCSNQEISTATRLSLGTVKNYVSTILLALDVKSRSHLISLFR